MDEYMRKLDEAARQKQREEEEEEEERKRRAAMPLLKETAFDRRKVGGTALTSVSMSLGVLRLLPVDVASNLFVAARVCLGKGSKRIGTLQ